MLSLRASIAVLALTASTIVAGADDVSTNATVILDGVPECAVSLAMIICDLPTSDRADLDSHL